MTRVALVPGVPALLPEYAGLVDPVAELRAACLTAVGWLGRDVTVVADPQGRRVAEHLLAAAREAAGPDGDADHAAYLLVGNGSACRFEKAPGPLDERSLAFDHRLRASLVAGDAAALGAVDEALARELWAGTGSFGRLAGLLTPGCPATVDYDDDPHGVQYWVMRWTCEP